MQDSLQLIKVHHLHINYSRLHTGSKQWEGMWNPPRTSKAWSARRKGCHVQYASNTCVIAREQFVSQETLIKEWYPSMKCQANVKIKLLSGQGKLPENMSKILWRTMLFKSNHPGFIIYLTRPRWTLFGGSFLYKPWKCMLRLSTPSELFYPPSDIFFTSKNLFVIARVIYTVLVVHLANYWELQTYDIRKQH